MLTQASNGGQSKRVSRCRHLPQFRDERAGTGNSNSKAHHVNDAPVID